MAEYACLKLETAEIKLDFGHIIQDGVKGAQKYLDKHGKKGEIGSHVIGGKPAKKKSSKNKKEKSEEV